MPSQQDWSYEPGVQQSKILLVVTIMQHFSMKYEKNNANAKQGSNLTIQ